MNCKERKINFDIIFYTIVIFDVTINDVYLLCKLKINKMKNLNIFLICAVGFILIGCANPKVENNKQIVTDFFDLVSEGKTDNAFELIDNNVNWWIPGDLPFSGNKTKKGYMQVINAIKTGFPTGFKLSVISSIAEGNKVAAEVESFGNHANGRVYENKYHFLFEIKDGKIKKVKEYMDTLHLYQLLQP